MDYTDTQLKRALAKMLPEKHTLEERPRTCSVTKETYADFYYHMAIMSWPPYRINKTELLHLVSLVEAELRKQAFGPNHNNLLEDYLELLYINENYPVLASWQQRVIALAKVLNVEIVQGTPDGLPAK